MSYKLDKEMEEVHKKVNAVRQRAWAPYSKFSVGAALKLVGKPDIFYGCNVENASFGATLCAERSALAQMVSTYGELPKLELEWVMVVADIDPFITPCGICRQSLSEFSHGHTKIYLASPEKCLKVLTLKELLPHSFSL